MSVSSKLLTSIWNKYQEQYLCY